MRAFSHIHNHTMQERDQPTHTAEEQQKEHQKARKRILSSFQQQHPVRCSPPNEEIPPSPTELWKRCTLSVLTLACGSPASPCADSKLG